MPATRPAMLARAHEVQRRGRFAGVREWFERIVAIEPDAELRASPYSTLHGFQRREVPRRRRALGIRRTHAAAGRMESRARGPDAGEPPVVYRSDLFQAISDVFGTTREDARLVQLFFFAPH